MDTSDHGRSAPAPPDLRAAAPTTTSASVRRHGRAARVTAVCVRDVAGDGSELTVTARRGDDRVTRTLHAPPATIRHAAVALARHYGLAEDGPGSWAATDAGAEPTRPEELR